MHLQLQKGVFDALGAETHVINDAPDGTNINKRMWFNTY